MELFSAFSSSKTKLPKKKDTVCRYSDFKNVNKKKQTKF